MVEILKEGIYEEIINSKVKSQLANLSIDEYSIDIEKLDAQEARKLLSTYISTVTRKALSFMRDDSDKDSEVLLRQIRACNEVINSLSLSLNDEEFQELRIEEQGEVLTSVYSKLNTVRAFRKEKVLRPVTSLSQTSLFTGSHYEPNMLEELRKEIATSDFIDWLVSFIKWSGLRIIMEELRYFTQERKGKLRVITTSYMEATDYKAIEELSKLPNTEIRISYDKNRTRLHAKAYLFKRETGFSTAYIGSSNLSNPALTSGLEWNLKVTERDSIDVIRKFEATFESYWNDADFKKLDINDPESLNALKQSLSKQLLVADPSELYVLDVHPYSYQQEILDQLEAERETHGRYRNLIVAATGVGKTVISAFDFKRYYQKNPQAKFLFIAHREEILKQSLTTFRAILKDQNFGEMLVGKHTPKTLNQVFMSIQSWNSKGMNIHTTPEFYDYIVVDEFHHAAAPSYRKLLAYYHPKILLGLTATPERMDGDSILTYFDDYIASEMRLTEAIDRKLLSPFHYFAVSDSVDLSTMKWSRRGYDHGELENVYTDNRIRSELIIKSLKKYVTSVEGIKGLGFCVSVKHAQYMADFFEQKGIPSIALHGDSSEIERGMTQKRLTSGEIKFIFVVDLYNEGIDIPEINTMLFLRPTESITVFLQQLGRGLRLSGDKECLTVLDFIGQAHKDYPFEEKLRALVGRTKHSIRKFVEDGFIHTPRGSEIILEKQAKEYILRNIKATKNSKQILINKMKYFEADTGKRLTLSEFLKHYHLSLAEFYGTSKNRLFERMKVEAGLVSDYQSKYEDLLKKRIQNFFHLDSADILKFYIRFLNEGITTGVEEEKMIGMLYYSLFQNPPVEEGFITMEEGVKAVFYSESLKAEILQVMMYRYEHLDFVERPHQLEVISPLRVHAHYSTDQILAAFNYYNEEKKPAFREGVKYFPDEEIDIFFVTLNKSDKDFSESTMYEDYALNDHLFHWQSQSRTSVSSPTAQRYINHFKTGNKIALFVREYKKQDGNTSPFTFLGTADYVKHEGSSPVSFTWKLHEKMPAKLLPIANKNIL